MTSSLAIGWKQRHTCDLPVPICMLVSACMAVEFLWVIGLAVAGLLLGLSPLFVSVLQLLTYDRIQKETITLSLLFLTMSESKLV